MVADRVRRLTHTVAPALIGLLLTGCTSTAGDVKTSTGIGTVPAADRAAVADLIDAINATAAGPVAAQQAVFASTVDPALTAGQQACAPATITIRIDPVPDNLRLAAADTVQPTGTHYTLPVLLEVYTGRIRTGTDLTALDLSVTDGVAHTFPLCLV